MPSPIFVLDEGREIPVAELRAGVVLPAGVPLTVPGVGLRRRRVNVLILLLPSVPCDDVGPPCLALDDLLVDRPLCRRGGMAALAIAVLGRFFSGLHVHAVEGAQNWAQLAHPMRL